MGTYMKYHDVMSLNGLTATLCHSSISNLVLVLLFASYKVWVRFPVVAPIK